jgi:hypothetical protein
LLILFIAFSHAALPIEAGALRLSVTDTPANASRDSRSHPHRSLVQNPVFGDSFTFAGLVAGIEVIGAFRLFAGQLLVRISVVIVGHRVLHRTQGNSGADAKFLF